MNGPILDVQGVSRYFASLRANDDVSLTVASSEIVGLIGPNGAGKSTLFNLIAGALMPTAGRIVFEGRDTAATLRHRHSSHLSGGVQLRLYERGR